VDSCVLFERFCPWKFTVGLPGSSGLSSLRRGDSPFGWKLFKLAQPSTMVPSTVKCSSDNNSFSRATASTAVKNSSAISPRSKRSRFLLKVVAFQNLVVHVQADEPAKQHVVL